MSTEMPLLATDMRPFAGRFEMLIITAIRRPVDLRSLGHSDVANQYTVTCLFT